MRKLIMWNMLTVDGSAGGRSEVADRLRVWGEELLQVSLDQARTVDALLLGRTSYELMSEYWSSASGDVADLVNATPKVVFSRTLKPAAWSNTRLVTADPASEVARLKRQPGRDLLLLGQERPFVPAAGARPDRRVAAGRDAHRAWRKRCAARPGRATAPDRAAGDETAVVGMPGRALRAIAQIWVGARDGIATSHHSGGAQRPEPAGERGRRTVHRNEGVAAGIDCAARLMRQRSSTPCSGRRPITS